MFWIVYIDKTLVMDKSSTVFNEATIKLMENFGWKRISSFHNSLGVYYSSTASDFIEKIRANSRLELVTKNPTTVNPSVVSSIFDSLVNKGGRIVYVSVTGPESGIILCEAYKRGYIWPGYAYIFNEVTVADILSIETVVSCSEQELIVAMEGVLLLQYRLEPDPDTVLVSDMTYHDYWEEYLRRLSNFAEERDMNLQNHPYANVLYDGVWAFALALTNSLERLNALNITLADFRFGDSETTDIIQKEMQNISFHGATGPISFNSHRETKTSIDILQVRNGEAIPIGVYLSNEGILNITEVRNVPEDHFATHYQIIPEWLAIAIFTVCGLLCILTTINLLLYIIWHNKPEIKASSPYLSLLMFAGCYMLYAAVVLRTLSESFFSNSRTEFAALCTAVFWFGATGFILIIATLFVKMLRVHHVFFHFGKTSKLFSNQVLLLAALALSLGEIAILSIWTVADPIYQDISESYVLAKPQAYYVKHATCSSDYMPIWLLVAFAYIGMILALVVFIAIQTRHIKRQNFKDTKKVNIFVFCSVTIATVLIPLWYILSGVGKDVYAHAMLAVAFLLFAVFCQIFLFVPKTLPLFWKRKRGHRPLQLQFSTSVMSP